MSELDADVRLDADEVELVRLRVEHDDKSPSPLRSSSMVLDVRLTRDLADRRFDVDEEDEEIACGDDDRMHISHGLS